MKKHYTSTLSLLLLLPLINAGCAPDSPADEPSCEEGACDGLGDFRDVKIIRSSDVYYACADELFDNRCLNSDSNGAELTFPTFITGFASSANVAWVDLTYKAIDIEVEDQRILASAERPIQISDISAGINGYTSRGGLSLEYRTDGEESWNELLPSTSSKYWDDVQVLPTRGVAQGTVQFCSDGTCYRSDKSVSFEPIKVGVLVEYRMAFIPIWNTGDFDEGEYSITYDLD